jgi:translation initiation factor 1A
MGKKKVLSEGELKKIVLPADTQVLGFVSQMLGYDRLMVKCTDGHERTCRIRGKMKRKVWIKANDVVLVDPWEFQSDRKGDILWRYTGSQVEWLKNNKYLNVG